jgi:hypothetical protein
LGKYVLRHIKHLMSDLGHPHIFTAMLDLESQFNSFKYVQFTCTGLLIDPEDIDISAADCPTHDPPDPVPEPTTNEFGLFQGDFILYSQLMSHMTLDPGVRTSGTQYEAHHALSFDNPDPSTRVPETQTPAEARHERPRCEI